MRLTDGIFQLFTTIGAEWVLWILAGLSVVSVALIVERLLFFLRNRVPDSGALLPLLSAGEFEQAKGVLEGRSGLEVEVLAAALEAAPSGPAAVEEVIAGAITRHRQPYERYLSFLGTLGNNAPFIGLFGTVIGIIEAFAHLAIGTGHVRAGAQAVMSGISESLVATAVGIFVAIPAVVAFNGYNRWLRAMTARTNALGHAVVAYLKSEPNQP